MMTFNFGIILLIYFLSISVAYWKTWGSMLLGLILIYQQCYNAIGSEVGFSGFNSPPIWSMHFSVPLYQTEFSWILSNWFWPEISVGSCFAPAAPSWTFNPCSVSATCACVQPQWWSLFNDRHNEMKGVMSSLLYSRNYG